MDENKFMEKYSEDLKENDESFKNIASILRRHEESLKGMREELDDVKKDMEEQDDPEAPAAAPEDDKKVITDLTAEVERLKAQLNVDPEEEPKKEGEDDPEEEPKKEGEDDPEEEPEKPKVEKSKKKGLIEGKVAKELTMKEAFSNEETAREAIKAHFN